MTTPAPEPVEVPADELAAAEEKVRLYGQFYSGKVKVRHCDVERVMAEYDRMRDRLLRIAEAHSKSVDSAGGTWCDCAECGWNWPCPTNVWATTSRDVMAPWIPADDEGDDDE